MATQDSMMFDFSKTSELDDDEIAAAVSPILGKPEQVIALNDSETALAVIKQYVENQKDV